jgi:hypothetical protein
MLLLLFPMHNVIYRTNDILLPQVIPMSHSAN